MHIKNYRFKQIKRNAHLTCMHQIDSRTYRYLLPFKNNIPYFNLLNIFALARLV